MSAFCLVLLRHLIVITYDATSITLLIEIRRTILDKFPKDRVEGLERRIIIFQSVSRSHSFPFDIYNENFLSLQVHFDHSANERTAMIP